MGSGSGEASVEGGDWRGVALLDDPERWSLEEVVGLDPKEWRIVGLDLWGGALENGFALLAVPRAAVAQADGTVAATRFEMPLTTGFELLRRLGRWSIHAQRPGSETVVLSVERESTLPYPMARYDV